MALSVLKFFGFLQKYRTPLAITSCSGVFAANMSYHIFPDMTYRKLYQAWHKGWEVPLSKKLLVLFQEALKDYGISSPKNFSAFASSGFQPIGAGVPWLPAGAQVGIPANFNSTANDSSGITNRSIFINGQTVDWKSDAGSVLKDSLVLSEEAKKFAIARELARLQCGGPVLHAVTAPVCLGGVWVYSVVMKQIFGLHSGPLLLRGAVNVLAMGLGYVSYIVTSDAVSHWVDSTSDRQAAGVSHDYAKGGVEFYDKILSRNKIMRLLMGKKGEEVYAPSGNLFPSHLLHHKPYTSRREELLALLKEVKA